MPHTYELTIIDNNKELGVITETNVERLYNKYKSEFSEYCTISGKSFKKKLKGMKEDNDIVESDFICKYIKIQKKTNSEMVINNIKRKKMYIKYLVNYLKEHDMNDFLEFKDFKISE